MKNDFTYGLKRGLPIALGYIPVSFTFGLMAVNGGLPVWLVIFISLSNLTSAGQFAGTNLMIAGSGYLEITLTTFVINIRYMLMSLSLSQKIKENIPIWQRLIFGFGITDETFLIASVEPGKLSTSFLVGLMTGPIVGWTFGTALGAMICSTLPVQLSNAMGIALYGMFIAIVVPVAKKSKKYLFVTLIAIVIHCALRCIPIFQFISKGFQVILATILAAGICAYLFPREEK